ncbi:MAG: DNA-3-methyladenine glycosylase 2 family protein, partial [Hyphomicrobiales bacterium]|nr:DNA-3-methyladenine glycosylase 2 family protein [Hyphomicrobiales bacterium]
MADRASKDNVSKKRGPGKAAPKAKEAKRPAAKKRGGKSAAASRGKKEKAARPPREAAPPNHYHPGPLIDSETSLAEATARLLALDPELIARLIEIGGPPPLRRRTPGFAGLAAIIVSQQVSVASANAIFARLEAELAPLSAATLLEADDAALRRCGLSLPKMRALRALAAAAADGLDLEALGAREAHEAHQALIAVKGIGPWTADIFLLFCLGHPDAFPAGDLALQEAARLALSLEARPDA